MSSAFTHHRRRIADSSYISMTDRDKDNSPALDHSKSDVDLEALQTGAGGGSAAGLIPHSHNFHHQCLLLRKRLPENLVQCVDEFLFNLRKFVQSSASVARFVFAFLVTMILLSVVVKNFSLSSNEGGGGGGNVAEVDKNDVTVPEEVEMNLDSENDYPPMDTVDLESSLASSSTETANNPPVRLCEILYQIIVKNAFNLERVSLDSNQKHG